MSSEYLSKSNFMHWLIHPAYLWLEKHDKKKLPPIGEADEFLFAKGHEFEAEARKLFPDGKLVDARPWEFDELVRQTQGLMASGAETIFQATALTGQGLLVKSDVLQRSGDTWDLYEVKSSARVKDDHITDLAFQVCAWEDSGIKIGRSYVYYVNRDYVRGKVIDADKLVAKEEVTEHVREQLEAVRQNIPRAFETLRSEQCPSLEPSLAGSLGIWMPIYMFLHPDLPDDHPYRLAQLKVADLELLEEGGYGSLKDVADTSKLNSSQRRQVSAWQMEPAVNRPKIEKFLSGLEFPLWFLDYETISHAVPIYPGTKPYQDIPFQYSLHMLEAPGKELKHFEHLVTSREFPVPEILKRLEEDLGSKGSILVWYQNFEKMMNSRMAHFCPQYAEMLNKVNERIVDLMIPFSSGWYTNKHFRGSASIKNVMPVVAPKLSYKSLDVQDGSSAQAVWYKDVFMANERTEDTLENLRAYCALDTMAMVEIYSFLVNIVEESQDKLEQTQLF